VTVEQDVVAPVEHEPLAGQWGVEHDRIGARVRDLNELEGEIAREQGQMLRACTR
jgi:hypothetical protein